MKFFIFFCKYVNYFVGMCSKWIYIFIMNGGGWSIEKRIIKKLLK